MVGIQINEFFKRGEEVTISNYWFLGDKSFKEECGDVFIPIIQRVLENKTKSLKSKLTYFNETHFPDYFISVFIMRSSFTVEESSDMNDTMKDLVKQINDYLDARIDFAVNVVSDTVNFTKSVNTVATEMVNCKYIGNEYKLLDRFQDEEYRGLNRIVRPGSNGDLFDISGFLPYFFSFDFDAEYPDANKSRVNYIMENYREIVPENEIKSHNYKKFSDMLNEVFDLTNSKKE